MNNFKDSKFSQTTSSFFPKPSYNKAINMNLLANKTFGETLKIYDGNNANVEKINRYIKKSLNIYNRNIDDVTKNNLKNRFDNVTFKTIKHIR